MHVVFMKEDISIHHILKYPSSVVLSEQGTMQSTEMSRNGYSFVTRLEFVLSVCHCEEHHAFHKLWTTPKESYQPEP
jgi:hypothetical protein